MTERLKKQLEFIVEIDKIKQITRQTLLFDGSRYENDAEHSWHIAVMALILAEYSNESVDILRVIKMLLIHDLVEIDAGDTFLYSNERDDVQEKEKAAAERIFGLLPEDQSEEFLSLWNEFEEKQTPESKLAGVFDRLEPLMQNSRSRGVTWNRHQVSADQVRTRQRVIAEGSQSLWQYASEMIEDCVRQGWLKEKP